MRTVYLGTSEFAASVLGALAGSEHRPTLVLTRPDRPKGRGRRLTAPPVALSARSLGLQVCQPDSVNAEPALERIAAERPERVIVCAFGALIKEPLLSAYELFNVHPSLLPRWRGAAPVERSIMAGDEQTGVSIMRLTAGLDTGPVCLQQAVRIEPQDTYATLVGRLAELSGQLLLRALDELPKFTEQAQDGVTYAEKITAEDRELVPAAASAVQLARTVRALTPHIGAWVAWPEVERLGVLQARALPGADLSPGDVALNGLRPRLGCAEGVLELTVVQPPGRRAMDGEAYLRGRR